MPAEMSPRSVAEACIQPCHRRHHGLQLCNAIVFVAQSLSTPAGAMLPSARACHDISPMLTPIIRQLDKMLHCFITMRTDVDEAAIAYRRATNSRRDAKIFDAEMA